MAVDWSQLPQELLNLISKRFDVELDLIRFQSICSTWRSSSVPNHHHILPFKFPRHNYPFQPHTINNNNNDINYIWRFHYLRKQSFFLIKPHQEQEQQTLLRPWLINISQNTSGKTQLFPPLIHCGPIPFTQVIDFNKFSVLHLGSSYIMDNYDTTFQYNVNYIGPFKVVAVTCHGRRPLIVGTLNCVPQPILLKCRNDENWKVIPDDMSIDFYMGDICLFKGQPYATDKFGKTIMVGLDDDSSVQLVAEPLVDGGDMKFLVESEGDLLLADVYECIRTGFPGHDPVRIDVFKLNEKEKKWLKLTSLGDRVLFLNFICSFSASASDLCFQRKLCYLYG